MEITFTEEEKTALAKEATSPNVMRSGDTVLWTKAFDYYNSVSKRPLSMKCRPCYSKVAIFILTGKESTWP